MRRGNAQSREDRNLGSNPFCYFLSSQLALSLRVTGVREKATNSFMVKVRPNGSRTHLSSFSKCILEEIKNESIVTKSVEDGLADVFIRPFLAEVWRADEYLCFSLVATSALFPLKIRVRPDGSRRSANKSSDRARALRCVNPKIELEQSTSYPHAIQPCYQATARR